MGVESSAQTKQLTAKPDKTIILQEIRKHQYFGHISASSLATEGIR